MKSLAHPMSIDGRRTIGAAIASGAERKSRRKSGGGLMENAILGSP